MNTFHTESAQQNWSLAEYPFPLVQIRNRFALEQPHPSFMRLMRGIETSTVCPVLFHGWQMEGILGSVFARFERYASAIAMQFCMQGEEDNLCVFTNMKEFEQLLGCMGLLSTTPTSDALVKRCIKWHAETLKQVQYPQCSGTCNFLKPPPPPSKSVWWLQSAVLARAMPASAEEAQVCHLQRAPPPPALSIHGPWEPLIAATKGWRVHGPSSTGDGDMAAHVRGTRAAVNPAPEPIQVAPPRGRVPCARGRSTATVHSFICMCLAAQRVWSVTYAPVHSSRGRAVSAWRCVHEGQFTGSGCGLVGGGVHSRVCSLLALDPWGHVAVGRPTCGGSWANSMILRATNSSMLSHDACTSVHRCCN